MFPDAIFKSLLQKIEASDPHHNVDFIRKAYDFAKTAHKGQKRKSGFPYITHCLYTAINLTRIGADTISIVSALLHDVPEDTEYTIHDVEDNFGPEVAMLVNGVTKLSKVHYKSNMHERDIESLRKMFISVGKDLRIILIKICDRLHNLQTLKYLREDKRVRIARETLEIYVPIVHLLSIGEFMGELEDLCFKNINSEAYDEISKYVESKFYDYESTLDRVQEKVLTSTKKEGMDILLQGRVKSVYSIYKKMKTKNIPIEQIHDILALRIVVGSKAECYQVLGIIHSVFKTKNDKFKDYISSPKHNGYQSIHSTVFDLDGNIIEFQIQSKGMRKLNKSGIASHYVYKNLESNRYSETPEWVKNILDIQKGTKDASSFLEKIKDEVFTMRIQCYTPMGDQIDLPKGATLLDFAFSIHSDFGNKFIGAYINNEFIGNPLHQLSSGDVINLIKSNKNNESYRIEYINIVKTNFARECLKKLFKTESEDKRLKLGKFLMNSKMEIFGMCHFEDLSKNIQKIILNRYYFLSIDDLYDNIAAGNIDPNKILKLVSAKTKEHKGIKQVDLKIFLKVKDFKTQIAILDVFYNLNVQINKLVHKQSYYSVSLLIRNFTDFENVINELSRVPNVREIKRIFPARLILFYVFLSTFLSVVIITPGILYHISLTGFARQNTDLINILFALTFILIIGVIYFFKYVVKITLPDMLNHRSFWISMLILNTLILGVMFSVFIYIQNYFNITVFTGISLIIYTLLAIEYIRYNSKRLDG